MFFIVCLIWNCFFASLVVFNRNSLYSIISFIFVILSSCSLLFLLKIEFLVFILLLIYIGAIAVLFLFFIMMLQLNTVEIDKSVLFILSSKYLVYAIIIAKLNFYFYFFYKKLVVVLNSFSYEFFVNSDEYLKVLFSIENDILIFLNIFTQKYFFFLIVGLILLFSMVGSIALCVTINND